MSDITIKYFLIFYFIGYYGVFFILNSYLVFKKTGINPYVLGRSNGVVGFVEKGIKITGILIPVILLIFLISDSAYQWLAPIHCLEISLFQTLGITLMFVGFIVCFLAQHSMRTSWRIGIKTNTTIELVKNGIFKYSRNPFFLGTLLSYTGFFFVLPSTFSLTAGIAYFILIQIQIRFEEDNLKRSAGDEYVNYMKRVRRWI